MERLEKYTKTIPGPIKFPKMDTLICSVAIKISSDKKSNFMLMNVFLCYYKGAPPFLMKSEGIINVVVCVSLTPFFLPSLHHRRVCVCVNNSKKVFSPSPLSLLLQGRENTKKSVLMSVCVSVCVFVFTCILSYVSSFSQGVFL